MAEGDRPAPRGGFGAALAASGAASARRPTPLLRNHGGGRAPVSNLELFFDLVYVFAVTQLSHILLERLTLVGAVEAALLWLAVWWAWVYTAWATNWIDPDRVLNRFLIGVLMVASLVIACTLPGAFGRAGPAFATAYVMLQVGRTFYTAWARGEYDRGRSHSMIRTGVWFVASSLPWTLGVLTEDVPTRIAWWSLALAIEYAGPFCFFRVPGLGRSHPEDWDISGGHMAERCALFIIIALGEGLVMTGATFATQPADAGRIAALAAAFVLSFATWWVYFDIGATRGARHIEHDDNPGLIARDAFTYWHMPIVAGIIVLAVADEMVLAHPFEHSDGAFTAVLAGGLVLFLGGTMAFKKISSGAPWFPLSHGVGLTLILGLVGWTLLGGPSRLTLSAAAATTLGFVAVWEWVSFHGGWIERFEAAGLPGAARVREWSARRRELRLARAAAKA